MVEKELHCTNHVAWLLLTRVHGWTNRVTFKKFITLVEMNAMRGSTHIMEFDDFYTQAEMSLH